MGTRLSIILPVYNVEAYLPACLDSVLSQTGAELEVIAVDDASPDGSGRILDEYAAHDARLRVLHLPANRGLGGARAAGLEQATGEYVWFVDSDDWLAEGALAAIAERLASAKPDVLITDFSRSYPDGGTEPNTWRRLMTDPPLPEVFSLTQRPALLQMIMAVWNKVIRREFLEKLQVGFGAGYYEDISVTYPILLAAERLTYLDKSCYFYRRMREGAITGSTSAKHLDAFAQYDEIFSFMDRWDSSGGLPAIPTGLRRQVFDRTVKHAVTVYTTPRLIPEDLRPSFFRRMTEHFNGHVPSGYRFSRGPRGLQYRMVASGSLSSFDRLQGVNDLRLRSRRTISGVPVPSVRQLRGAARFAYYQACMRLPIDEQLVVYAAYWYSRYGCNPAAIYEKARELAPSLRGVWVVANRRQAAALPDGVPYVIENTPSYFKAMATAKYLVNNVNFPHTMVKRPGTVHVQTQHGTPLKTMGMDLRDRPEAAVGMDFERLAEHVARWDYLVSPNPHSTQVFTRVYPGQYEVLETGYPRNDRLAKATDDEEDVVRARLGIPQNDTVILYAPTHREGSMTAPDLAEFSALADELGPDHTILMRPHYFEPAVRAELIAERPEGGARLLDVSGHPSVEDLCIAADVLVTDYSSVMFDYAVLDRPIVIYAPDWEQYRRTRGVYFDLPAEPPGAVATDMPGLIEALRGDRVTGGRADKLRSAFRDRFAPYDDGQAAERVVRRIFPVTES